MKRFFCLILALLLLAPAAAADEEKMTFHLEGASGEIGDTVTIVGSMQMQPGGGLFSGYYDIRRYRSGSAGRKKAGCEGDVYHQHQRKL